MEKEDKIHLSTLEFAQRIALPLAFWWIASFACHMQSANLSWLGFIANGLGIFSLCMLAKDIAIFRALTKCRNWLHLLWLALITCLLCTLLTTFAQYLYFQFLDGGLLLSSLMQMMETPDFDQLWMELQPNIPLEDFKNQLATITISDITMSLLWFNVFLSLPFALLAALCSRLIRITIKIE